MSDRENGMTENAVKIFWIREGTENLYLIIQETENDSDWNGEHKEDFEHLDGTCESK